MVKFGEELQSQLVPEWQDAYCCYDELKHDLDNVEQHRTVEATYTRTGSLGLLRSLASVKPGLSKTLTRTLTRRGREGYKPSFSTKIGLQSKDIISIDKLRAEDGSDIYVTELQEPLSESPQDRAFFARLDEQLTKVNKFYKKKEAENIARAGTLEQQMLSLFRLQEDASCKGSHNSPMVSLPQEKTGDSITSVSPSVPDTKEVFYEFPLINEDELLRDRSGSNHDQIRANDVGDGPDNSIHDYINQGSIKNLRLRRAETNSQQDSTSARSVPLSEIHSQQDSTSARSVSLSEIHSQHDSTSARSVSLSETHSQHDSTSARSVPLRSALKKVSAIPEPVENDKVLEDVLEDNDLEKHKSYSLKELDHATRVLRRAFVEFFRVLGLLSNYRSLNIKAFAKILKKYDKITGWHFVPIYMKEVESSHFVVSTRMLKLMSKVEDIYTKYFCGGDHKKAISQLRPTRKQGTHRTTFFLGLFSGCSMALFLSFFYLVSNPLALDHGGGTVYLNTVFPVFSTLMLVTLHMFFYGFNVYAWQRTRINYPFIFGLSTGSELRYREVLLLSTGFTTFLLGGMNMHIIVTLYTHPDPVPSGVAAPPSQHQGSTLADIIPLLLVLITLMVLFFPLNTIYRSSRAFFLGCFRRLALAPFHKVILPDFFLGDQFTSQVLVFRNFEFIACYYSRGFFLTKEDQACIRNPVYQGFGYVVAMLPFWWRFLQCLRRYYDEEDKHHLQNAGKYMSAIVAVGLRQAYTNYRQVRAIELPLRVLFIIASIFATIYSSYWDFCVDWGLLKSQSRNKWLRDKLISKKHSMYFAAIGANVVLRLAWLATLLQVQVSYGFNQNAFDVIMASLEVLRRGIWNFFRIENEHLNNVGKYRAETFVPLPFNDDL